MFSDSKIQELSYSFSKLRELILRIVRMLCCLQPRYSMCIHWIIGSAHSGKEFVFKFIWTRATHLVQTHRSVAALTEVYRMRSSRHVINLHYRNEQHVMNTHQLLDYIGVQISKVCWIFIITHCNLINQ